MQQFESEDIVIFDPSEKLIKVRSESVRPDHVLVLDVIRDIYSAWKRWAASGQGIIFGELVKTEGGNIIPGGVKMPVYVILQEGWKIQCPDNCNKVEIYGNLISSDGRAPFVPRPDGHHVSYEEITKIKTKKLSCAFIFSIAILFIAEGIIAKWIYDSPNEMEPYSAFLIVLFTIVQLITQARKA